MHAWRSLWLIGALFSIILGACGDKEPSPPPTPEESPAMTLELSSSAFAEGQPIPARYTCTGEDISPPLTWRGAPAGTQSFALIMDDPDAPRGTWVHWVVYNLPASATALPEAIRADGDLPGEAVHWAVIAGGATTMAVPARPAAHTAISSSSTRWIHCSTWPLARPRKRWLQAMQGHVLAQGQLMGTYKR